MLTNARDATYVAPPSTAATTAVTSTMVTNALSAADRFVCSPATDMWTPPEWLVLTRTRPPPPPLPLAGHDPVTIAERPAPSGGRAWVWPHRPWPGSQRVGGRFETGG